jgi:hypothetical protein
MNFLAFVLVCNISCDYTAKYIGFATIVAALCQGFIRILVVVPIVEL